MPTDQPTFEELLSLLKTDASKAATKARDLSKKLTIMRYEIAAIGVGYAYHLARNENQRENFYKSPFWRGRLKKPNAKKLLLHCMMYVYGSHSGSEAKRASDHARALEMAYNEMMPVSEIPAYIQSKNGFDGLLHYNFDGLACNEVCEANHLETAGENAPLRAQPPNAEQVQDRQPRGMHSPSNEGGSPPITKKAKTARVKTGGNGKLVFTPIPREKLFEHLIVEVDQPLFDEILNMNVGARRNQLVVKRLPDSIEYSAIGNHEPFKRFELLTEHG